MLLNGVFTIKLVLFWRFWRCNIRPKNWSQVCMVILVLFGVLPHPAQELMFIFRGSFRVVVFLWWCGGVFVVVCGGVFVVVFVWWCLCGGICVVVFVRWCFCGGVCVLVFLWCCFCGGVFVWCFCAGVVVFLWWWWWCFCGGVFVVAFLWWCSCGGVLVVDWCSLFVVIFLLFGVLQHPAQELMFIFRGNFRTYRVLPHRVLP